MSQPSTQSLRALIDRLLSEARDWSLAPQSRATSRRHADELKALLPTLESAIREGQAQPAPDALSTRQIASKIFFHCLLKGEKGNPFHGMNSDWFIGLVTPKLDELFLELAARPSPAAPTETRLESPPLTPSERKFRQIVDALEKKWPNLYMEGFETEVAIEIIKAALAGQGTSRASRQ